MGELEVQANGGSHCLMIGIDRVIYGGPRKVAENEGIRRMPRTLEGVRVICDNWLALRGMDATNLYRKFVQHTL